MLTRDWLASYLTPFGNLEGQLDINKICKILLLGPEGSKMGSNIHIGPRSPKLEDTQFFVLKLLKMLSVFDRAIK